ncbi:hypothetical protein [Aquitalea magnusonii]|uniref:hypothetical protein n=1 Tax=Aquitalea magnusonii TaxID=332411 RepID=UPI0007503048|nr:hypothetical protein [Aquitalea magnusonii]
MESTFKKKINIINKDDGSFNIEYRSFRFGMGIRLVLFLVMIVVGFLSVGLYAGGMTLLLFVAIFIEIVLFKLAFKTTHTITVTDEGILWAGGRKRLAFKDIDQSFTTQNLFGYGNSHGVQFSAQGTTVIVASDLEDKATAGAIADLIIKRKNGRR